MQPGVTPGPPVDHAQAATLGFFEQNPGDGIWPGFWALLRASVLQPSQGPAPGVSLPVTSHLRHQLPPTSAS